MRDREEHLSPQELAILPDSPEAMASGTPDQRQLHRHLQQCDACSELARTHAQLMSLRADATAVGQGCPPETVWLEFAAGVRPAASLPLDWNLAAHAAACGACASALREAMELMQAGTTHELEERDELDEPLEGLASATPGWQRRVALEMMATASPKLAVIRPKLRISRTWVGVPLAAGLALVGALAGVAGWRTLHPSDEKLLAMAYNKQRTMALRISGANPVAMASITRGAANGLAEPSELLELKLRAQKHLDETPNSPHWHQVMGEIELEEQDGAAARRNFEIAEAGTGDGDGKLANLQPDLAAAWFEIGDKSGNTEAYAEAVELLSRQIHDHPNDAMLFYNRALSWERQSLNENALDDLRRAKALEKDDAWRKAIEAEIAKLAGSAAGHAAVAGDGYEAKLAEATEKLLPQWNDSPDAREKLEATAALGLKHQDRWLAEWIRAQHTPVTQEADGHLAAAVAAGSAGEPERSLLEARRAMELYRQAGHYTGHHPGHHPGLLRAELAEVNALGRLQHTSECLDGAKSLLTSSGIGSYAWLEGRGLAVQADCLEGARSFAQHQQTLDRVMAISKADDLPVLGLRALGAETETSQKKGLNMAAWQTGVRALQACELAPCPANTHYSFLYLLANSADVLDLHYTAAEIMRSAAALATETGNAMNQAYTFQRLGILDARVDNLKASSESFDAAAGAAMRAGKFGGPRLYLADLETDRAEILSQRGMQAQALDMLRENGPMILASEDATARMHYRNELTSVERAAGREGEALNTAWDAVHEAERTLGTLQTAADKEHWQRANANSYAELVRTYLKQGDDTQAFEAWERFRTAPYRAQGAAVVHVVAASAPDARVLVIAHVGEGYIGWVVGTVPLRALQRVELASGSVSGSDKALLRSVTTFYRLCADASSSVADVKAVGGRLYGSLLKPFEAQLGSGRLYVEVDPSLGMLPFAALTRPDGRWLGAQVAVLSPWWTLDPAASLADTEANAAMRMVAVNGFAEAQDSEAAEVARLFRNAAYLHGSAAAPEPVLKQLATAEVFHFSGHAAAGGLLHADEPVQGLNAASFAAAHLERCRVGVLAACNTTSADPDQIEKLADVRNALLLAGTHAVVASNWDVDDRSTRALMLTFYRRLVGGQSVTQALQSAQETVRLEWPHPYYWAAFEAFSN